MKRKPSPKKLIDQAAARLARTVIRQHDWLEAARAKQLERRMKQIARRAIIDLILRETAPTKLKRLADGMASYLQEMFSETLAESRAKEKS